LRSLTICCLPDEGLGNQWGSTGPSLKNLRTRVVNGVKSQSESGDPRTRSSNVQSQKKMDIPTEAERVNSPSL